MRSLIWIWTWACATELISSVVIVWVMSRHPVRGVISSYQRRFLGLGAGTS